jgi:hypothetical protein
VVPAPGVVDGCVPVPMVSVVPVPVPVPIGSLVVVVVSVSGKVVSVAVSSRPHEESATTEATASEVIQYDFMT